MKIYTKTGDTGETSLLSGERVPKNHPRVELCGHIDELSVLISFVLHGLQDQKVQKILEKIQRRLFLTAAELSCSKTFSKKVSQKDIIFLEKTIDHYEAALPQLYNFIFPSGTLHCIHLHMARTKCRHVERKIVALKNENIISKYVLQYFNRLSDLLFVLARFVNKIEGGKERILN